MLINISLKKAAVLSFFLIFFLFYLLPTAYAKKNGCLVSVGFSNISNIGVSKYVVKSIRYELPPNIPLKDIDNFLYLKKGRKFSMPYLKATLRTLYNTGYFSNISVLAKICKKQKFIYLTFVFFPKVYIGGVNVYGLEGTEISPKDILESIPLKKGSRFSRYYETISINNVRKIMLSEGYPNADIKMSSYVLRNSKKYIVNINIIHNKPVLISKIFVKLKSYYPRKRVGALIKGLVSKPLSMDNLQKFKEKIWNIYSDKGYLNVIIQGPKITYISKRKAIVIFNVHPGYRISFHFIGTAPLKPIFIEDSLFDKKNVLIFNKETFIAFKRILKNFFKKKGYYFVKVFLKERVNKIDGTLDVYYDVRKGHTVKIKRVVIEGYKPFIEKTIRSLMQTSVTSIFNREYFFEKRLLNDINNIKNYYNDEGYLSPIIKYDLKFSGDKRSVTIILHIIKGVRTTVKRVYVNGLPHKLKSYKKTVDYFLKMQNSPLYIIKAENGKNMLATRLADSGFVFSKVKLDIKHLNNKKYVNLYYYIRSGPRVRIKNILIIGNTITKTYYIRSLLLFKKGQIYNQKKIIQTQNRLYGSGIFNYVGIKVENPQDEEPYKNIILKVKDAKPVNFSFGAGYGTYVRYKGFMQVENNNLFGIGQSLSMRLSKSAVYTDLLLNYYDPAIYNYRGFAFDAKGLDTNITTINYRLHKEGGSFSIIRRFSAHLKGLLSYGIFYNYLSGLNPGAQITPTDSGFSRISSISSSIIYNTKNNIFNPTSGNLTTLKFIYSTFSIDSQINFFKIFFHTEGYIPFIYNTVFLYSLRFGYIKPLPPTTQVPINERFFLGGRTTVRGFPQDSIGLVDLNPHNYPIGGDVMENYNLQLDIPIHKNFNLFIFQDGGNVFLNSRDIRPFALYKSAGAGIMYLSPIGQISFSYGFILNRKPYWPAGGVNFTVGTSF